MYWSSRPPRQVRQGPETALTIPRLALGPLFGERPTTRARWPTWSESDGPIRAAGRLAASIRSAARSEPGSRPANFAPVVFPSGSDISISSSRRMECAAVTITPARQWTPLEGVRPPASTATTLALADCASFASSFERLRLKFSTVIPPGERLPECLPNAHPPNG